MDIADLQNVDDDAADWDFKASDAVELDGDTGSPTTVDEKDVATEPDNEAAPGAGLTPPTKRRTGNAYVDGIIQESGLHIIRDKEVKAAYKRRHELGPFSLSFLRGKAEATVYELDAYIGLEIAMSFNPFTEIKDFAATVGRNRFESIRARFQVHAPGGVSVERREEDPLWHSRRLMALIQAKLAAIAVPVGAESLDENTVRTNARSAAKTYMPSKTDKYGLRFYAVVGWESLYAYSVRDNDSGDRTRTAPAERYVAVFPALRTPLFSTIERADIPIKRKDASALWVAMCGHLTKAFAASKRHRLLVCDNVYTRHNLTKTLTVFTDGEMGMLGTVQISLQGKWNAIEQEAAKARIDVAERGSWSWLQPLTSEDHQSESTQGEERLSMSILAWALDLALINAFSLFQKVAVPSATRMILHDFKRRVIEQLTAVQRARLEKGRRRQTAPNQPIQAIVGADDSIHAITPNSRNNSTGKLVGYLCSLRGFPKKVLFGCTGCHRGFHVACFSAFHFRDALTSTSLTVRSVLDAVCAAAYLNQLELP
ncbi:hypothetical protein ON010_g2954 [Phytophthora cinnamomi]|nr:hypothetical protein ON010_g2954 [Phytophthora cinnamomi]